MIVLTIAPVDPPQKSVIVNSRQGDATVSDAAILTSTAPSKSTGMYDFALLRPDENDKSFGPRSENRNSYRLLLAFAKGLET